MEVAGFNKLALGGGRYIKEREVSFCGTFRPKLPLTICLGVIMLASE